MKVPRGERFSSPQTCWPKLRRDGARERPSWPGPVLGTEPQGMYPESPRSHPVAQLLRLSSLRGKTVINHSGRHARVQDNRVLSGASLDGPQRFLRSEIPAMKIQYFRDTDTLHIESREHEVADSGPG